MIDGNKSFEKKVVVYLHLLASSFDATDCDIQLINGLGEIS